MRSLFLTFGAVLALGAGLVLGDLQTCGKAQYDPTQVSVSPTRPHHRSHGPI